MRTTSTQVLRAALLVVVAACGSPDSSEPGGPRGPLGQARQATTALSDISSLDEATHAPEYGDSPAPAQLQLVSGRMSRVPVSKFFKGTLSLGASHHVKVKSVNCVGDDDIAIVATFSAGGKDYTFYNDDHPEGLGNGKCSYLDLGARSGNVSYTIYVFSKRRATAKMNLVYDTGDGVGFRTWTSAEVGGTLVGVGGLGQNEHIEVKTPDLGGGVGNGSDTDTEMLLFAVPGGFSNSGTDFVEKAALPSDNRSHLNRDPKVTVTDDSWVQTRNYVLLSKVNGGTATRRNVEVPVDLVRGPVGSTLSVTWGGSVYLQPGRYYLSLFATQGKPLGSFTSAIDGHRAGAMPYLDSNPVLESDPRSVAIAGCPSVLRGDMGPETNWYRGQHNQKAFTMSVQRTTSPLYWPKTLISSRTVLRGAMGTGPGDGYNRFVLEVVVQSPGFYRLNKTSLVSDLTFHPEWRVYRNPTATEVKVATANVLFGPKPYTANEMRNYADLLGTRGDIKPTTRQVIETKVRGPFQWDVDIFGLQEANKTVDGNEPDNFYTDIVRDELNARGAHSWDYVRSRGETWTGGVKDGPGMNPLYVRDWFWPGQQNGGMFFPIGAKVPGPNGGGGCAGGLDSKYFECELEDNPSDGEITNYMSGAKAAAWRGGGDDRPIAAFNVHLESSKGAADFDARHNEVGDIIKTIKDILVADPGAFNRSGSSDPKHYQNRIVIFGDWNTRTHECGEHYWIIRRLREAFGYAVDVATAIPDLLGEPSLGMHTYEEGYSSGSSQWPMRFQYPFGTQSELLPVIAWQDETPLNFAPYSFYPETSDHRSFALYPWWASTGRTKTDGFKSNGERYDMIFLVGKGWAYDDPVLQYKVMVDKNRNALNSGSRMDRSGRAVTMWDECNAVSVHKPGSSGYVEGLSYAPRWSLGCGTGPGEPAIHTDHKPVGVRLRVWER